MLNNDTVVSPDMLTELLALSDNDPKMGIAMPSVFYYGSDEQIWSNGGRYRIFPPAILMTDRKKMAEPAARLIEFAPGCGFLIHRRAFERVGLLDPGFFFLFDDWDFSKRVRKHGLNIWQTPRGRMWHKVSVTSKGPASPVYWRTFGASSVRYYRKHGHPVWISLPIHLGFLILREFVWKRNWRFLPGFWEGFREGLKSPLIIPNAAR
jgi:GT2 family glycosyltransferase